MNLKMKYKKPRYNFKKLNKKYKNKDQILTK